jgi:hypothetical protein
MSQAQWPSGWRTRWAGSRGCLRRRPEGTSTVSRTPVTAWKAVSTPAPPKSGGSVLNAVSGTGGSGCGAVGCYGYNSVSFTTPSLAEQWNGTKWTRQVTPSPGSDAMLYGVACPAATDCGAVAATHPGNPARTCYSTSLREGQAVGFHLRTHT